ncbi:MAG: hypothetical protein GEU90_10745 [Gemmatimonas sp.]|nr:hypothetical protein [Gemmatimonas sp.]
MADISVEREQKQSGNFTWIWAIAAIVAVVGLMAWLFSTQPTATEVVTADGALTETPAETAEPASTDAGEAVELPAIGATPDAYMGRELRVSGVEVAAVLGTRGFWADVPGANPFLVILGPEVDDASWLTGGATVTLEGTVEPVTDTELDAWVEGETIRTAARDEASFATHFLQVNQVEM